MNNMEFRDMDIVHSPKEWLNMTTKTDTEVEEYTATQVLKAHTQFRDYQLIRQLQRTADQPEATTHSKAKVTDFSEAIVKINLNHVISIN